MSEPFDPKKFISFISHNGKSILYVDYSQCKDKWEMIALVEATVPHYKNAPGKILSLSDYNNVTGSPEYMNVVKQLGKELFDAKTERGAVLGITGLKKVLLQGYNLVSKQKIMAFDTKDQALKYLTE